MSYGADTTLYAIWRRAERYTLTFNKNCIEEIAVPESRQILECQKLGDLPQLTREGYYFDGWWTASSGGVQLSPYAIMSGNIVAYAHWIDPNELGGSTGEPNEHLEYDIHGNITGLNQLEPPNRLVATNNQGATTYILGEDALDLRDEYAKGVGRSALSFLGTVSPTVQLTSLSLPNAKYIYIGACGSQKDLVSVDLPNAKYIGTNAFTSCVNLKSVNIPMIEKIDYYGFGGCTSLEELNLPSTLKHIGGAAFNGCTSLTNVTIPDSVTSIGSSAFYNCSGLKSVKIPQCVVDSSPQNLFGNCP